MKFSRLRIIFYCILGAGAVGCGISLIVGMSRKETQWGPGGISFLVCFFTMLLLVMGCAAFSGYAKKYENNLILKEYGQPASKTKSYYYHVFANLIIPALFTEPKSVRNFKFSPEGLYYNDRKEILRWENVACISTGKNIIKIEAATKDGVKFTIEFPNHEVHVKLIKTFYNKNIEELL